MPESPPPAEVQDLISSIRGARAVLKLLRRDIAQLYNVGTSVVEQGDSSLTNTFLAMYPSLESYRQQYMADFNSILQLCARNNSDNLFPTEDDLKNRSEINSLYYQVVKFYQALSKPSFDNNTNPQSVANQSMLSRSRLPKISIPKFSGNICEWPKFKQLFESIVHSNTDVPVIEKYHYLSTSLTGEALALIAPLTINDENYVKAWETLTKRYDNKRLLATSYLDKILEFSPLTAPPSTYSLQSFITNIAENIAGFKSIGIKDEVNFLWLTLALRKLDPETRKQFEIFSVSTEWPTYEHLVDFVQGRHKVLQLSEPHSSQPPKPSSKPSKSPKPSHVLTVSSNISAVCSCTPAHPLSECNWFRLKSLNGRRAFLKGKLVCYTCLKPGHVSRDCSSTIRCRICKNKHHTLLHGRDSAKPKDSPPPVSKPEAPLAAEVPQAVNAPAPANTGTDNVAVSAFVASVTGTSQALLGTAMVSMFDVYGQLKPVRILVDCGSQLSLVTADCARRLGLPWSPCNQRPLAAGETPISKVKGQLRCKFQSNVYPQYTFEALPLVVTTITGTLPTMPLKPVPTSSFHFKLLADPNFWNPSPIDFLCGSDLFMKILTGSPTKIDEGYEAIPTTLGLILMGNVHIPSSSSTQSLRCHCLTQSPLCDNLVTRFWETEEVSPPPIEVPEDPCEEHYVRTHYRNPDGRYVVALPFKEPPDGLEDSYIIAKRQFNSIELKMAKHPDFKSRYIDFMNEYLELGHMSPARTQSAFVIPHHGVFKHGDSESKIRVVFNASVSTQNGSLNDKLYTGPTLQQDLRSIIMNFRRHRIAVTGDIVKMYRQILIRREDRKFLHILWRPDPSHELETFELNTVTYGVRCAPFQAIRTVKQLVMDEGNAFPLASKALSTDTYVDDIVSGAETMDEALQLTNELTSLLSKGKFEVHKWTSNSQELLSSLGLSGASSSLNLIPKDNCCPKILGMVWDPSTDSFLYELNILETETTKRGILSVIARLFDPMGFLAPIIFRAKTILQSLWQEGMDWDDRPDQKITSEWLEFFNHLKEIRRIRIPRFILIPDVTCYQVIGFCDASLKGYASTLYLRVVGSSGVKVSLLQAKTKLAPLKPTRSIPQLELCAAHLLAKLLLAVQPFLRHLDNYRCILFTDSTIVLGWINQSPHLFQTFVSNRISYIITHTEPSQWFHVLSQDNPADTASRGIDPLQLTNHSLWWAGPPWLLDPSWSPLPPPSYDVDLPDLRPAKALLIRTSALDFLAWMERFSNYRKLLRATAYARRILDFVRVHKWTTGPLLAGEVESALQALIRIVQRSEFEEEFSWETSKPKSKRLQILAAFLDNRGVIRVGGRLQNSDLPEATKFPIILPGKCHLVHLLVDYYHAVHYHLGPQALMALLGRQFWIFRLRQTIRPRIRKCLICIKSSSRPQPPIMGNLPSARVTPCRPFSRCGVDFAGPFLVKTSTRRNASAVKAYLALFICLATRAVHLEVVSSLSTDCFLATLDRFVARRGRPSAMYSDNGTNFVGAARRLKELFLWLRSSSTQNIIQTHASDLHFTWHFNPPHAPHFGGIWEAAIKSAKAHLSRIIRDRPFSYEELTTVFTRIEAILNSRPLGRLDDNSTDCLTPGHFLIGAPLLAMPETETLNIPTNRLSRWQLVSNSVQHFWKRWHTEYLHTLQRRPKWYHHTRPLQKGDVVLLSARNSAPLTWKVARIHDCHPGSDGVTRVVTIRDNRGIRKVPVHNLVSLSHLSDSDT